MKKILILLIILIQQNIYSQTVNNKKALAEGKDIFLKNCAACHVADGGGLVGPNLTDNYWIYGCGIDYIVEIVTNGSKNGMPPWQALGNDEILKVSNYILSLQGTKPKKPKSPEGNPYSTNCITLNNKTEYVNFSKKYISIMASENAKELKNLLPIMDEGLSFFSRYISHIKNKFIHNNLKGWKLIEAKGYMQGGHKLDIIAIDAYGNYFIYHGLEFIKKKNKIYFRISNDDISKYKSKVSITKDLTDRGGNPELIHWF